MSDIPQVTPPPVSPTEKLGFMDAFSEDKNEVLTLVVKLRVKGEDYEPGTKIQKGEKISGVDFHILRYLDLAVKTLGENHYEVVGFIPQK